jgi:hypothetical protein
MLLADFDADLAAWSSAAVAVIAFVALWAGIRQAMSANATFRLEAEARLIIRRASESRITWNAIYRVFMEVQPYIGPRSGPSQIVDLQSLGDVPVFFITGKPDPSGNLVVSEGIQIQSATDFRRPVAVAPGTRYPVFHALRVEVKNLGRSPAVQVSVPWKLSAPGTRKSGDSETLVQPTEYSGEADVVIDGVGSNDSASIWIANTIGLPVTLLVRPSATQRDPKNVRAESFKRIDLLPTSSFKIEPCYQP